MLTREVDIRFSIGIHSRPAVLLIQKMKEYPENSFLLSKDGRKVNGLSLSGILSLGITQGSRLEVTVDGPGEKEAAEEIIRFIRDVLPAEK
jgi:phosphotransferase system HPr (HPr) family protein